MARIRPPDVSDGVDGESQAFKRNYKIIDLKQVTRSGGKTSWFALLGAAITGKRGSQLADLPRGYVFAVPRSHDSRKYILGHPSGKSFRRSADFLPHLKWLMSGGSSETPCICCLCHPDRPLPSSNLKRPSPHSNASKGKRITGSLRKLKHVVIELPRRAEMAPVEPSELVPIPHTLITPAEPWC